jgi:hypothetical protein
MRKERIEKREAAEILAGLTEGEFCWARKPLRGGEGILR